MPIQKSLKPSSVGLAFIVLAFSAAAAPAVDIELSLKDHKFSPAEPTAPAGQPITISMQNLDTTPAEFESKELRFEKVVKGNGQIAVRVRALAPGRYKFYDDYHEDTTIGFLVVK